MSQLGTEFRVGLFTLVGLAAIVLSFFVLSPEIFESDEKVKFYTVLQDASGIMPKTHVKTNGVTIGKVTSVELDINATKVVFEIKGNIKVPHGSQIEVRTVGFLGDKFLEIKRADDTGEYIEEGGLIPRIPDSVDLNKVISLVGSIAKDIKRVTSNLADVLGGKNGKETITKVVSNIELFSEEAKGIVSDNRNEIKLLVANLTNFSKSINKIMNEENRERLERILAAFDESMIEVKGASKNFNLISEKVEKGEGTIGRLVNDDKTLSELEGAITDLRNVLAPVSELQVEVDYHGEIRTDESTQNYFNLNFRTRPDSHYVLGFVDHGKEVKQTTTDIIGSKTTESIKRENAIRFNLQIAKRWYWAGVRFGLFESTGGIASDFYLLQDKLRVSFEAFDFTDKDENIRKTAHLKAYASVLFFNHIYTMIGIDDPTKIDPDTGSIVKTPNYFFGAGVNFTDQDLKALFGIASLASP